MLKWAGFLKAATAAAVSLGVTQAVHAETITVEGVYAARVDMPASIELVLIDRFEGELGQDLEIALIDALGNVFIRGEPYFDLITPNALSIAVVEVEGNDGIVTTRSLAPDAELRGTVRSEVIEQWSDPKIERECVARDEDDKCIERREIKIECRKLSVRVDPRLLLTGSGGEQLYSQTESRFIEERFCADHDDVLSSLDMENRLINYLADDIRRDLAPRESRQEIRVMERRKNLRKEDRRLFRNAVKATDESVTAACEGFQALEATNPEHVSVLFNIGLCHESSGELNAALDYYARALTADPGRDYPTDGLRRVRSRIRAEDHLAQRASL
ncbi:tetratricopeptide repeat protein [uncultured Erythrobacter sp.]|uniref:tetratricopeptide repeat protein n=1 Tax=uncultured Erythrobacter sp. TaxID=263913 RepID=UPI00261BDBA8|nr:tetratricopeptide repeat protein [uncultured Erythrobacter sp.]